MNRFRGGVFVWVCLYAASLLCAPMNRAFCMPPGGGGFGGSGGSLRAAVAGNDRYSGLSLGPGVSLETQRAGYSVFPALIGGVAGLAVGGVVAGPAGALAGSVGGFVLGNMLEEHLGRDYGPLGYPQMVNDGLAVNLVPGIAGAVLGMALTASMGPMAWIVGGSVGFFAGKLLARLLFPRLYYGGTVYPVRRNYRRPPPVNTAIGFPRAAEATSGVMAPSVPSGTGGGDLKELKARFYDALHAYRLALQGSDMFRQKQARNAYVTARDAYFAAKQRAFRQR